MTELYGFNHRRDPVGDYQKKRDHDEAMRRFHEKGDAQLKASREWLENYKRTVPRQSQFNWQGSLGSLATTKEINDVEQAFQQTGKAAGEGFREGMGDKAAESESRAGSRETVDATAAGDALQRGVEGRGEGENPADHSFRDGGDAASHDWFNDPIPF